MIFLDQPAGAGYLYSTIVDNTPDAMKDVYEFLVKFFKEYPEFINRPFHIAGSSYSGHSIPELAKLIIKKK